MSLISRTQREPRKRRSATVAGRRPAPGALRTVATDLSIAAGVEGADLVHSHTWYANLADHLAKLLYGIPHVVSVHSLEPLRPGGFFLERIGQMINNTTVRLPGSPPSTG